jgi:hypothetical protein
MACLSGVHCLGASYRCRLEFCQTLKVGALAVGRQGCWAAILTQPPTLVLVPTLGLGAGAGTGAGVGMPARGGGAPAIPTTTAAAPAVAGVAPLVVVNLTFALRFAGTLNTAPTFAVATLSRAATGSYGRTATNTAADGGGGRGTSGATAGADLLLVVVEKKGGVLAVAAVDGSTGTALWQTALPMGVNGMPPLSLSLSLSLTHTHTHFSFLVHPRPPP